MSDQEQLREQFIYLARAAMRHCVKQDTFQEASLFGYEEEDRQEFAAWNNDTLVAAIERIIMRYVGERWGIEYDPYTIPEQGWVPPKAETLQALGLLEESADQNKG